MLGKFRDSSSELRSPEVVGLGENINNDATTENNFRRAECDAPLLGNPVFPPSGLVEDINPYGSLKAGFMEDTSRWQLKWNLRELVVAGRLEEGHTEDYGLEGGAYSLTL